MNSNKNWTLRLFWVLLILFIVFGCQSIPKDPVFSGSYVVENRPLPSHYKDISVDFPGEENQVVPMEEGEITPFAGILVSEKRAARDALCRIHYDELRSSYVADRAEWKAQRSAYELINLKYLAMIEEQNQWINRNIGAIGLNLGIVLGSALTIGVLSATEAVRVYPP